MYLQEAPVGFLVEASVGTVEISCLDVMHDCLPPVPVFVFTTQEEANRNSSTIGLLYRYHINQLAVHLCGCQPRQWTFGLLLDQSGFQ